MPKWREVENPLLQGVIVASDRCQEWILPWWWDQYHRHNDFPVTFVDLGLSQEAQSWCREKGECISLPEVSFVDPGSEKAEERILFWQKTYHTSGWRKKRGLWHKKPVALLQSPYERSLWLDIDCEVRGDLAPVFSRITDSLLLCPETKEVQEFDYAQGNLLSKEILFNSGVIGFRRNSSYILKWAQATCLEHFQYFGDQNLLSRLIYDNKWPVDILDSAYNFRGNFPAEKQGVKIVHWVGETGKFFISQKQLGFLS
jgi:hypothetical protein